MNQIKVVLSQVVEVALSKQPDPELPGIKNGLASRRDGVCGGQREFTCRFVHRFVKGQNQRLPRSVDQAPQGLPAHRLPAHRVQTIGLQNDRCLFAAIKQAVSCRLGRS